MHRTTACPSCGAGLRPDAPWCTLCYTDLRPKPAPEPVAPAPTAAYRAPVGDPLTQPLHEFLPPATSLALPALVEVSPSPEPTWPCVHCSAPNPMTSTICSVCGSAFLASEKNDSTPLLVVPGVGDIGRLSRAQRIGLALGAVTAVLLPLAVITLLLTGSPPKDQITTVVDAPTVSASP